MNLNIKFLADYDLIIVFQWVSDAEFHVPRGKACLDFLPCLGASSLSDKLHALTRKLAEQPTSRFILAGAFNIVQILKQIEAFEHFVRLAIKLSCSVLDRKNDRRARRDLPLFEDEEQVAHRIDVFDHEETPLLMRSRLFARMRELQIIVMLSIACSSGERKPGREALHFGRSARFSSLP